MAISYNGRLAQLAGQLDCKDSQTPTMVLFLGKRAKDDALDQLFPDDHCHRRRTHGSSINLRLDRSSTHSAHPIMLADCDPSLRARVEWDEHPNVATQQYYPLPWQSSMARLQFLDDILPRLLFTFTDVICLFADDCGGLLGALSLLLPWARSYTTFRGHIAWRPHIVVTTRITNPENEKVILTAWDDDKWLQKAFASVSLAIAPSQGEILSAGADSGLEASLLRTYAVARADRASASILFSATHVSALFERALDHYSQDRSEPFDFIRASRFGNELTDETTLHIETLLNLCKVHEIPSVAACSLVASATLVDAYPPGMHSK
jgi:hypothetical protein